MLKYIGNSRFEGCVEFNKGETVSNVEIECDYKTCKCEDADLMYDAACRYIEQFANGRKVKNNSVVFICNTETQNDGIEYMNKVVLQVIME